MHNRGKKRKERKPGHNLRDGKENNGQPQCDLKEKKKKKKKKKIRAARLLKGERRGVCKKGFFIKKKKRGGEGGKRSGRDKTRVRGEKKGQNEAL